MKKGKKYAKSFRKNIGIYKGYQGEKSIVHDNLAKKFPTIGFEEVPAELDYSHDIDFLGKVGNHAFGLQLKPNTTQIDFGKYSIDERMKKNFLEFEEDYGGKVFIVFSRKEKLQNISVLQEIKSEITRLGTKKYGNKVQLEDY